MIGGCSAPTRRYDSGLDVSTGCSLRGDFPTSRKPQQDTAKPMSSSEPQSEAERTALKVFHDLQLAHVRRQEGAGKPWAESPSERTSTAGSSLGPISGLFNAAPSPEQAQGPFSEGGI